MSWKIDIAEKQKQIAEQAEEARRTEEYRAKSKAERKKKTLEELENKLNPYLKITANPYQERPS